MIELKRIHTADQAYYPFVEELFISAFPPEERRDTELQREYTDHNPIFNVQVILWEGKPVGFVTYWDFDTYYYIEHFAIDPSQRNGGYGRKVLDYLKEQFGRPVVLEVELPQDELSTRRIQFYQRLGYRLWENEYRQPPYREGDDYLPMHLMVQGSLCPEKDFARIQKDLYQKVYGVKD